MQNLPYYRALAFIPTLGNYETEAEAGLEHPRLALRMNSEADAYSEPD